MPTHVGPNISGEENLVFGYDLSDQKNSYLGEPTTNLANNTPLYGGWPSSYTLIDSATKTFDFTTSSVEWGGPAAWTTFYYNVSEYTGQYVTISAVVESFDETSGVFSFMWIGQTVDDQVYLGYSPEEDRNTKTTKTRERISWSGVIGTGGKVGILIWMNNGTGGPSGSVKVRFSNLQVEVKSHPTTFINGTRSATQGLLDLTGNSTINLSSVSFDSNSQMTFDGTDDGINLGTSSVFNQFTGEFTIDTWVNRSNLGVTWGNIIGDYYTNNTLNALEWQILMSSAGNLGVYNVTNSWIVNPISSGFGPNTWVNVVLSRVGSTLSLYANSNLITSVTNTTTFGSATGNLRIGVDGNGVSEPFTGFISSVKIYNRGLTSSEVLNNHNNIKRKYGI
jgi:hypothetical protein